MAVIVLVTIAVSLLEGLNIGLLVPLLESLQSNDPQAGHWVTRNVAKLFNDLGIPFTLGSILLVLGGLVLVQGALKYLRMILVSKMTTGFVAWMRTRTMDSMLRGDVAYFHDERLGTLASTLTTQSNQAGSSLFIVAEIFALAGVIVAYLIAAFLVSPALTASALAIMVVIILSMQYLINRAKAMGSNLVDRNNELHGSVVESLGGIRVIKSFVLERLRGQEFNRHADSVRDAVYKIEKNRSQLVVYQEVALFALVGSIVYLGVRVLSADLAVTVALLFVLYRLAPRISNLNNLRQSLAVTMAALRSVEVTISRASDMKIINGDKKFAGLTDSIRLQNVSFSYQEGTAVLENADFTIECGKITAIVGSSGAGKSTLVDLILRFYDPDQGSMLVDGVDLKEFDLKSWRGAIGVVSQDIFLFNDTVINNILIGRPGASIESVRNAAKQAYAHEFIVALPDGYDTNIGDRGWNLSGGQRQRIALARAILKEPEILILDEATSSLDSESERLIQDYIRSIKGSRTIVVVAHRMSTIQDADKIGVLQDGKIVEEGDWDSLLAQTGVFASIHRLQIGNRRD